MFSTLALCYLSKGRISFKHLAIEITFVCLLCRIVQTEGEFTGQVVLSYSLIQGGY